MIPSKKWMGDARLVVCEEEWWVFRANCRKNDWDAQDRNRCNHKKHARGKWCRKCDCPRIYEYEWKFQGESK